MRSDIIVMANLRDRLKRIQESKKENDQKINYTQSEEIKELIYLGWEPCGYKVYKRDVAFIPPFKSNKKLPKAISILIPDLYGIELPALNDFLFFDLETTGLSGGAGTVAFLAAFGKFVNNDKLNLIITQYLLLDYPGENDFLLNVLSELNGNYTVVSYNGKCFDSQIIRTRCLMNRIKVPEYRHVDLLHPSRRLWKNIIHDCSQSSVEEKILKLSRTDDVPGSLAPEIWFEFLKTGRIDRLKGICDHNTSDIFGLASILSVIISIAENPVNNKYQLDLQRLALFWRRFLKRSKDDFCNDNLTKTGNELLRLSAQNNYPRAVYVYAYDQMKCGNYIESLKYVNIALKLFDKESVWHEKLLRRKTRLERIINL